VILAAAPDRSELVACLTLLAAPRLPDWRALELLQAYGSGRAAVAALAAACGPDIAAGARSAPVRARVARALHTIDTEQILTIPFGTGAYPRLLVRQLGPEAPPVLFALGNLGTLELHGIGVVGCRAATEYGLDVAEQIGGAVARAGGCVISGLARGVDAVAPTAALDAGGRTVAVLGCGVDVYYPHENMKLQDRIRRDGLLLSEFLPGDAPRKYRFPHRNRIIAALSAAVVVVEAGEKSGAVRTAEHSMSMGTATYAVPNAMDRPNAQGILGLYRDGVLPFTGVRDLVESVGLVNIGAWGDGASGADALDAAEEPPPGVHGRVWGVLDGEPALIDGIAAAAGLRAGEALAALLELELDGRVRQLSGGRFARARAMRRVAGTTAGRAPA
jgi:DNA processing protein